MIDEKRLLQYANDPADFQDDLILPGVHGRKRFGDIMAPFQRERFAKINPAILALARGEKPPCGKFLWEASKGCSKDTDLSVIVIWLLAFCRQPLLIQVGAADKDQAAELRKAATDVLDANPWLKERVKIDRWQITCTATGGVCEIVASDDAGSQGARPDLLILNELSCIVRKEFAENLMDNATKKPHGVVVMATNAGFLDTWQHKWCKIAYDSPKWIVSKWSKPSPWLDQSDLDEAKLRNSLSRFNRLFWGIWCSGAGDALDAADLEASIMRADRPHLPTPGMLFSPEQHYVYLAGLDLSVKRDHSALVVLGVHRHTKRFRVAQCTSWKPGPDGVDLAAVQAGVLQAHHTFRLAMVNYDPHQAALMAQQLIAERVTMNEVPFTGKNCDKMASVLLDSFRSRRIDIPAAATDLIRDLGRLSIVERSWGYKLEAPHDKEFGHCDNGIALALALINAGDDHIASTGGVTVINSIMAGGRGGFRVPSFLNHPF